MNDKFKAVGHLALSIFLALLLFSMQQPPTIKIQNQLHRTRSQKPMFTH